MHRHTRLLLAGLTAAFTLAVATGTASAGRLSVDFQFIRATWEDLSIGNTVTAESVLCSTTIESSFHSATLQKTNALIGLVSRFRRNGCTNGSSTIDEESLPWHLSYESFTGRLPLIESLKLLATRVSFLISIGSLICRMVTSAAENATFIANLSGETVTSLAADASRRIALRTVSGFGCGLGRGFFTGAGSVSPLGRAGTIRLRLI